MSEKKARLVKLFCPSVAKMVSLEAWEEQRLDLGSIARAFGLDPSTLKLNGHFIGRGVDLVSSSVTWKSLLSFFSAKGLSTGANDGDPIVVDGKLCKVGTKRGHESWIGYVAEDEVVVGANSGRPAMEDINLVKSKKMRTTSNSGFDSFEASKYNGICSKRKQLLEDVSLLKKLRINDTNPDIQGRSNNLSNSISSSQFRCSYMNGNMKRMREAGAVVAAPCKKIR